MIVVIQCAGKKWPDAGHLVSSDGRPVVFVANPRAAPTDTNYVYARPDDEAERGMSWRDSLLSYNKAGTNPLKLRPAYRLYRNQAYGRLANRFGVGNLYILSAGWGLISADFLTPYYDITFTPSAKPYQRRRKSDRYGDFCLLPRDTVEPIAFFGGKDYIPLFCTLTQSVKGKRTVFYNSTLPPEAPGCTLERFETAMRTNWHYECANYFIDRDDNW
jgi:hypothetical protein